MDYINHRTASELCRPSDLRLSAKLVPAWSARRISYGGNLGFLDRTDKVYCPKMLKILNKVNSDSSTAETKRHRVQNAYSTAHGVAVNIGRAIFVSFRILRFVQDVRIQLLPRNNRCILSHP
jgi:hypothetical protein